MRPVTPREAAVLRAYIRCGSLKLAADELRMHDQTAKFHLTNVRRRLGVNSSAQAAYLAGRAGWRITLDA